jgi:hypothetical protein
MSRKQYSTDLGVDDRIILKLFLGKYSCRCGLNSTGSEQGSEVNSCEHGDKILESIKRKEFPDHLSILLASEVQICSMVSQSIP